MFSLRPEQEGNLSAVGSPSTSTVNRHKTNAMSFDIAFHKCTVVLDQLQHLTDLAVVQDDTFLQRVFNFVALGPQIPLKASPLPRQSLVMLRCP